MPYTATVAIENSMGPATTLSDLVIFHVWPTRGQGPLSEVFFFGHVPPGQILLSGIPANSGSGGHDYWTLLFTIKGSVGTVFAIPTTVSDIASTTDNGIIKFIVEPDGDCTITNPKYKNVVVTWAALAVSKAYAFLSDGVYHGSMEERADGPK